MAAPGSMSGRAWHGGMAFLLSVLIHGLVVLACVLTPGRPPRPVAGLLVEQRVRDEAPALGLFLTESSVLPPPSPPRPQSEATLRLHARPAEPSPPAVIPVLEGVPLTQSRKSMVDLATDPNGTVAQVSAVGSTTPLGAVGGQTALFEIPAVGQSVVFVLDRSASMGQSRAFAAARREIHAVLERLPATSRFQVIVYNRVAEVLRIAGRADLVPATPENVREAARLLHELVPEGSTDHLPALRQALALQADVVFVVTDAHDLKQDQTRAVTRLNHRRSVIHAVVLGHENPDSALRVLARENRGEYRCVAPRR